MNNYYENNAWRLLQIAAELVEQSRWEDAGLLCLVAQDEATRSTNSRLIAWAQDCEHVCSTHGKRRCPICHGSGYLDSPHRVCEGCGGTGET